MNWNAKRLPLLFGSKVIQLIANADDWAWLLFTSVNGVKDA
ncbi:hypothetical protein N9809_01690 [Amylibacter sp.]|nr:hypothetical protein [Amylibacter sp.]